ncbi:flagellar biosynthesis protein FliQ [Methyloferula stellata]|jgi:flagellar biosynthesis protein FliQ|uniref:flagellar biosynthesis protein FliQ n=1 Tax=Methyloferula stellata TaxID=876270 RepID=UPI00037270AF|nr:flagellar biosynthesis protein FliQ [Methyloferula stellata]
MNEADALEIIRSAVWTIILGSGPAVGTAMGVGVVIALFQALTQIQEMTLTFVPKILAIFVVMTLAAPFIGGQVYAFTEQVYSRIEKGY